jgi:serine/threonine protein kinase
MHTLGVIHGDLKPVRGVPGRRAVSGLSKRQVNILVDEHRNARLVDFGLTTVLLNSTTQVTTISSDGVGGTLRYMAPELHLVSDPAFETPKLNVLTDIYALSITLWEVCSSASPSLLGD